MIKLYEHPFSPYVQKVKIAMYEKNIPFEAEIPNASKTNGRSRRCCPRRRATALACA
jgi:glutathione S-transferase